MRILVACERSGRFRDALLALGHDAYSCDTEPTRVPGPHLQCDVREVLGDKWDGLIAHPVCKYLTNAGAKHLYRRVNGVWAKENGPEPERWRLMEEGAKFFNLFRDAVHIPRRAIENPIMHGHARALVERGAPQKVKPQYAQPWWFGDAYSKATGWWLYGLPRLVRENEKSDYEKITQECWLMTPSDDREEKRSQTYPGMARACSLQWFGTETSRVLEAAE